MQSAVATILFREEWLKAHCITRRLSWQSVATILPRDEWLKVKIMFDRFAQSLVATILPRDEWLKVRCPLSCYVGDWSQPFFLVMSGWQHHSFI